MSSDSLNFTTPGTGPPGVGGGWGVAKVGGGSGVMGVGGWEGCETAVISSGPVRGDGS